MLTTMTVLAFVVLADPPARKEPPTQQELAAITERGRDLAGYDAAAWHASDATQTLSDKLLESWSDSGNTAFCFLFSVQVC